MTDLVDMLDGKNCSLCGQEWCGRPCVRDPKRSNGLLFTRDGRRKTLKQRGLGCDSPPLVVVEERVKIWRPNPSGMPRVVNDPVRLAEIAAAAKATASVVVTKTTLLRKPLVTETSPVTKTHATETRKGGRPKKAGAVTAAERMRRMRAAKKKGG